ncbi:hypothetical protein [Herbaspirillum huttiense]|uniref:Uncharacterized protein n=1 Tax=Herbaspirillum huttiense subsp. lycopersici TaxID=3074428 RepID=A0ABU2EUN7_9BURK|nr:hypothetical protein [Herbaspirillum huttiense]MDR9851547.1 hypothetical protein [Herbaspirillum huttiense SE1]
MRRVVGHFEDLHFTESNLGAPVFEGRTMKIYATGLIPIKGYPIDTEVSRLLSGNMIFKHVTKSIRSVTEYIGDGSTQEVLVPQVYIHASNVQVTGQGTLIAGNDVAFQAAQDIVNSGGTIAGRQSVSLAGNNVQNLGRRISGSDVTVAAAASTILMEGKLL